MSVPATLPSVVPAAMRTLSYSGFDFRLRFSPENAALLGIDWRDETLLAGDGGADFGIVLDGVKALDPVLVSHQASSSDHGLCIRLECRIATSQPLSPVFHAIEQFDVTASRLERRLYITCLENEARLLSTSLSLIGADLGVESKVSVPMARAFAGVPLASALRRPERFEKDGQDGHYDTSLTAPDVIGGLVCVERPGLHLSVVPLPRECPVGVKAFGRTGRLVIRHDFEQESRLAAGESLEAGAQVLQFVAGPWQKALPEAGIALAGRGYAPPPDRPSWARNPVIYEVDLAHQGGLRALASRLGAIQDIGFDTLYLMPWHTGRHQGYGTTDYLEIDPQKGCFADLRELCDAAHSRGMKVLFDLLVNIAGTESRYPERHPEWFYRDAQGNPLRHKTWDGIAFDPASPGFRRFLLDYAVRCCAEWGADGFRVDAAGYRGGNWNPLPGLQPHQHSHAVFSLIEEIREAIRRVNPETILLAELFGPQHVPISDLVCFQWVAWLDWVHEAALAGQLDGATLQRLIGEHFASMPPGTWITGYTHTHDTVAFQKREFDGPPVDALFATLNFLCAGTMVFAGGWSMRERPQPGPETDEYRRLFAMKKDLGGVSADEILMIDSAEPALFVAERPSQCGKIWVVTNFSPEEVASPVRAPVLFSQSGSPDGRILPFDTVILRVESPGRAG